MLIKQVKKTFQEKKDRNWDTLYYYFDIHETILVPDYNNQEPLTFYPYAKETLQALSEREDIVLGLYTCSYPEEIERYQKFFKENGIFFKYVNENPEVPNTRLGDFSGKFYFSLLAENKAGFDANADWKDVYDYFV